MFTDVRPASGTYDRVWPIEPRQAPPLAGCDAAAHTGGHHMATWARFLSLMATLTLCTAVFGAATDAKAPAGVGLVINEDGDSIATIDLASGSVIGSTDISTALDKPHLAAYDAATQRLYVGSKGAKLAAFDLADPK